MKSLVIFGSGGHCKSCIDVVEHSSEYEIKGIITHPSVLIKSFMGYKVLGSDENYKNFVNQADYILIGIGQIRSPLSRINMFNILNKDQFNFAKVISSFARVSKNAEINSGSIIMHNALINADAVIGLNCIINSSALIEHDVKIEDHCHISTGAIINGGTQIGKGSFIGSGCIVKEGIKIGENVLISAGQIVMRDIPSNTIFKGES